MTLDGKKLLDEVGWRIMRELQADARLSFAELGRRVGLSLPAVAERVRRMENVGIITGYSAQVNLEQIGLPVLAFMHINVTSDQYSSFLDLSQKLPQILECHHITGTDAFIMKVAASSIPHLEILINRLNQFGQTTTSIVLSSPITKRELREEAGEFSQTD